MSDLSERLRDAAKILEQEKPDFGAMDVSVVGRQIVADRRGKLWLLDADAGTMRPVVLA
jgi:hypothetical protein